MSTLLHHHVMINSNRNSHDHRRRGHNSSDTHKDSFYISVEYIMKEMEHELENRNGDEFTLIGFFDEFYKTYEIITSEDIQPVKEDEESIRNEINEIKEKQMLIKQKLSKKIDIFDEAFIRDTINGLFNSSSCLYSYENLNANGRDVILKKQIKYLQLIAKFLPFKKNEINLELDVKQAQLENIRKAKLARESFMNLSAQEKLELLEYRFLEEKIILLEQACSKKRFEISNALNCNEETLNNRRKKTLKRILNKETNPRETLDKIFKKFDQVLIKKNNNEYTWNKPINKDIKKYREIIEWLKKEYYDPYKKSLDRKIPSDKKIIDEDEHEEH